VIARRTTLAVAGLTATSLVMGPATLATAQPVPASHVAPATAHFTQAKVHGLQPKPNGSVELTWAPTYMADLKKNAKAFTYTRSQALSMAGRFDLIGAIPASFQKYVTDMKQVNPNLTIISYANATFLNPSQGMHVPASEYARDIHGHKIISTNFGTYLMDPSNAAWRKTTVQQCDKLSSGAGYDGCLVDLLTMGVFSKNFVTALPVNRKTGKIYTQPQWRHALEKLARQYVKQDTHQIIIGNSVGNIFRYWLEKVSSRPLVKAMPGAQMEDFLRSSLGPTKLFPNRTQWLQNVKVISTIESSGRTGLFSTKLWSPHHHAQVAKWQGYAMASFLMAANGHSYFAFTDKRSKKGAMETDLPYSMPKSLGLPKGAMKHAGRLYVRRFKHGKAIVNPTTKTTRVKLGGRYLDLQGHHVKSIVLKGHTGNVFVKNH
jgi:hypothetical protein